MSERKSPVRRGRWLLRTLVALVVIGALGGLVVWGFIGRRGEAALEAERERPIKAPLRVSLDGHGEPLVTLDAATRGQSGGEDFRPQGTLYQDEVRAYGTVLDLDKLVTLDNNYVTAVAQVQATQSKLVASKAAFERAEALYKNRTTSLAQFQAAEATLRAVRSVAQRIGRAEKADSKEPMIVVS